MHEAIFADIERQAREWAEYQRKCEEAARCPVAERIIANNQPDPMREGMLGCAQMFVSLLDPRTYKRKAAETLVYLRLNRIASRDLGLNHNKADAILLERAANLRRQAARLGSKS